MTCRPCGSDGLESISSRAWTVVGLVARGHEGCGVGMTKKLLSLFAALSDARNHAWPSPHARIEQREWASPPQHPRRGADRSTSDRGPVLDIRSPWPVGACKGPSSSIAGWRVSWLVGLMGFSPSDQRQRGSLDCIMPVDPATPPHREHMMLQIMHSFSFFFRNDDQTLGPGRRSRVRQSRSQHIPAERCVSMHSFSRGYSPIAPVTRRLA
jgi:hypothetical protein